MTDDALTAELVQYVSEHKLALFDEKIRRRTRHLTVVLEDVNHPQNASACLRSCECFGIQDVHIVDRPQQFEIDRDVTLGSTQWLTLHKYEAAQASTTACIAKLRTAGYRVVATSPRDDACSLEDFDLTQKTALLFGNEVGGLSDAAFELADDQLRIPTVGFTESLNISVAVGICLQSLTNRLRNSRIDWQLSASEAQEIKTEWIRHVVHKHWAPLEDELRRRLAKEVESLAKPPSLRL